MVACSEDESDPQPTVDFTFSPSEPMVGQEVQFVAVSTNSTSLEWSSVPVSLNATTSTTTHTFTEDGSYQITLIARGAGGETSVQKTINVKVPEVSASFTYDTMLLITGEAVQFTNTSIGASSFEWSSVPSVFSSTEENPRITFEVAQNYAITLVAKDEFGNESSLTQNIEIKEPQAPKPTVDFTFLPNNPTVGEQVSFTSVSTSATIFRWSSEPTEFNAVTANPSHLFSEALTYTITLEAIGEGGSTSISKEITVNAPSLTSSFSFSPISPQVGQAIQFTNNSTNAVSFEWSSSPSGFSSSEENPTYTFTAAQSYEITLVTKDEFGNEASSSRTIEVTAPVVATNSVGFLLQNAGQAYGKALSVDSDDNFYYTSLYQENISGTNFVSSGIIDNYFAKHDKNGNLIWERSFGGAGSLTVGHGIDIDAAQNVYLTGYFGNENNATGLQIDFGGGVNIQSQSGYDAFVCKYSASGDVEWAFGLGNSAGNTEERTWDIIVEDDGDFYVSGAFSGTVNFDPLSSTPKNESTSGIGHFIAKYNADGQNQWVQVIEANIENVFTEGYTTVDFDQNGNVFLAGVYRNSISLGSENFTSRGLTDFFLASFNEANGTINWAKTFGGAAMDIVSPGAMRVNSLGEPHITGRFSGTSNYGGVTLTSGSAGNTFVLACDNSGNTKWTLVHSSNFGLDGGHRVDFDNQNNVYVAGWFRGTASFDQAGTVSLTSKGTNNAGDVFLAKYNTGGQLLWVEGFGAEVSGAENLSICAGLGVDSEGNSVITGKFYGANADYDPSESDNLLFSSEGMDDCFVVKYTTEGALYKY